MNNFDAIVIGAGHAGVESALALARTGNKTLLLTLNLDSISFLACNPSIGGTAKGHLVCEIDALGGQMGISADANVLQIRMLNLGKGPAVYSLRAQIDKVKYHTSMKSVLENTENLWLKQAEVKEILVKNKKVYGIKTTLGEKYTAKAVVVATGVYLNSTTIIGNKVEVSGPSGFRNASYLTKSLAKLGFEIRRFKTGTPPRIDKKTINFSKFEEQIGDNDIQSFSFMTKKTPKNLISCYLGYTSKEMKDLIEKNLDKSPLYSGLITGTGPRYCPSIETKIMRFQDKETHQIFLEPESLSTNETYLQGLSTSLPVEVQKQMIASISGLENAEIMRYAYAIEYDCINSLQLYPTLESKIVENLYFAGQVNGTSGYEEAAAQGLLAGINANLKIKKKEQLVLRRDNSYIGVLIDDLTTKGTNEPYRMMTSRAEYRLQLRQDNADIRLTQIGRDVGLVDDKRYKKFSNKLKNIKKVEKILQNTVNFEEIAKKLQIDNHGIKRIKVIDLLKKNLITLPQLAGVYEELKPFEQNVLNQVDIEIKYSGYLKRQEQIIERQQKFEDKKIPDNFDYEKVKGLRTEAKQKLMEIKPLTIGQASRISGVNPADVTVLLLLLKK